MSEEIDEIEEVEEVEELGDPRLKKAVEMLVKQSGINSAKLEGKSLEEQFDLLNFYIENKPKRKAKRNRPVIPNPTTTENPKFGKIVYKDGNHITWEISTKDIINGKILKQL